MEKSVEFQKQNEKIENKSAKLRFLLKVIHIIHIYIVENSKNVEMKIYGKIR